MGSEWLTSIPIHNNPVAQLVEHRPFKARVVGSNPTGITTRDVVQSGRTLALGARGRWFKSSHLDNVVTGDVQGKITSLFYRGGLILNIWQNLLQINLKKSKKNKKNVDLYSKSFVLYSVRKKEFYEF